MHTNNCKQFNHCSMIKHLFVHEKNCEAMGYNTTVNGIYLPPVYTK